jgi:hypothetical protein
MYKIKIHGAGSIGNHPSNASGSLGRQVDLCDIDLAALDLPRSEICSARGGK